MLFKVFVGLALVVTVFAAPTADQIAQCTDNAEKFLNHVQKHLPPGHLDTLSDSELQALCNQYDSNMEAVLAAEAAFLSGNSSFLLNPDSPFMHLNHSDFVSKHTGAFMSQDLHDSYMGTANVTSTSRRKRQTSSYPTSLDWSTTPYMQPVKNQGECGCCWAFAAACVLETMAAIQLKRSDVSFSEQNIIDCDFQQPSGQTVGNINWSYGSSYGCNGGNSLQAFAHFLNNTIGSENPYYFLQSAANGQFNQQTGYVEQCQNQLIAQSPVTAKVTSATSFNNAADIIAALQNGPVSVAIYVGSDFQNYKSGVYSSSTCPVASNGQCNVNHAVTIVGYGTYVDGTPYWKVRNSWGPSWGTNGYVYIKRGVNMCCIETYGAQAKVNATYNPAITTTSTTTTTTTQTTSRWTRIANGYLYSYWEGK